MTISDTLITPDTTIATIIAMEITIVIAGIHIAVTIVAVIVVMAMIIDTTALIARATIDLITATMIEIIIIVMAMVHMDMAAIDHTHMVMVIDLITMATVTGHIIMVMVSGLHIPGRTIRTILDSAITIMTIPIMATYIPIQTHQHTVRQIIPTSIILADTSS
jgi:hypothetical protein